MELPNISLFRQTDYHDKLFGVNSGLACLCLHDAGKNENRDGNGSVDDDEIDIQDRGSQ